MATPPKSMHAWLQEDDAQVALQNFAKQINDLSHRIELLEVISGPKSEDRMFRKPFQFLDIDPGQSGTVYEQEVPPGYVGVVTRMGNDWFPNTVLTRLIDNRVSEHRIERVIAPTYDPVVVKIWVQSKVTWTAENNDGAKHRFGILTDGFFIPRKHFDELTKLEG